MIIALRGTLRMLAGVTGLLLAYAFVYSMEGMTTRIPTSPIRELLMSTLWMLPWVLLFCSGLHDLSIAAKRPWLFWSGSVLLIFLVYYYERNTSSHELTKSLMPLLIWIGGILPHVFRRLSLLYAICSGCAGLAGMLVLYSALKIFLSPGSHNTRTIAALMVTFALTSVGAGALSVMRLRVHDPLPV